MPESEFEQNLYQQRRDKLAQIAELGQRAGLSWEDARYPSGYTLSHTIPEIRTAFDHVPEAEFGATVPVQVAVAGRVMAIRLQGKAGFSQLQQGGQRLQIYVRKDDVGEDGFALYRLLDLGDHIGVQGHLFRTRTGELSVHAAKLTFLAKAMLPLPDKYHGLEDTELRYRQRYVDLFMNTGQTGIQTAKDTPKELVAQAASQPATTSAEPAAPEPPPRNVREIFVKRAAILRAIRQFFDGEGYLEVETPMMHTVAGGAAARPFRTHHNALDLDLSLRIAPELFLKRLVVGGLDRVYEINRNFRNEGLSTQHNPEFTMLEFYQAYANYRDLMRLTEELIPFVAKQVNGTTVTHFHGHTIDLSKWTRLTMKEAIRKWCPNASDAIFTDADALLTLVVENANADLQEAQVYEQRVRDLPKDDVPEYKDNTDDHLKREQLSIVGESFRRRFRGLNDIYDGLVASSGPLGKYIAALFEIYAEHHLIDPTIIYDFPLAVSPLSKQKPGDPDWVERFEVYIGGFEIGNAFSELNDPDEQRRRFELQLAERDRGNEEAHAMDEDYLTALSYGMPPTAGEGIGIDRLTMLLTNSDSIREVILFPLLRPPQRRESVDRTPDQKSAVDSPS